MTRLLESSLGSGAVDREIEYRRFNVLKTLLAIILLVAAGAKGHQVITMPTIGTDPSATKAEMILVITESALGLWLLANRNPWVSWWACFLCYSTLSGVATYKALRGDPTCGCFGEARVSPRDILALDLLSVAALLCCGPRGRDEGCPSLRLSRIGWLGATFPAGLLVGWMTGAATPSGVTPGGPVIGSKEVAFDPSEWVGAPFPLMRSLDIGDQIAEGRFIVLFYRRDCPLCSRAVPAYERMQRDLALSGAGIRVVLVEVPSADRVAEASPRPPDSSCLRGRLSPAYTWHIRTPIAFRITDGIVQGMFKIETDRS